MAVSNKIVKDPRSTNRRRARKALFEARVPYKCVDCGVTVKEPPRDYCPPWFEEIWPEERRELPHQLHADHETKDTYDNNIEHLNWRCPKHHKERDIQTEKGVSTINTNALWGDTGKPQSSSGSALW